MQIKSALNSEKLDLAEHDLRETGFHIIENVISPEEADEAREAIWKMVDEDMVTERYVASGQLWENHLSSEN